MILEKLNTLVEKLNASNSTNDKVEVLKTYKLDKEVQDMLVMIYSPYVHFGVSSSNCMKNGEIVHEHYLGSLECLLSNLNNRVWTGHEAIAYVNGFVQNHSRFGKLIWNIIDKDLKTRAGASLINKALPGLIPQFKVALAEAIDKLPDFENEEWLGSRKLDGVRCIIRKEQDEISAHSRSGKEFETLQKVLDDVSKIPGDFVLDGELCLMDKNGNEDFQDVMSEIRRKNHTIENPKFVIFDYLTLEEFDTKVGTATLEDRYINIQGCDLESTHTLTLLEQHPIDSENTFNNMMEEAKHLGHEGIMIRKNTGYKGKRSKDILKVKEMHDAEYTVLDFESGFVRYILDGSEVEEKMLSNIIIEHKGNKVGVGSGFSIDQRKQFHKDPSGIVNKLVTVQYFEESQNKAGEYSLRFPVLKHIYNDGRDC
jgi:DNA ligase-1